jgi:hypothetical protein
MTDKIKARIVDRGWMLQHVLSACDHCKRSRELGAGAHHTRWWLGNQLEGYARGLHGLNLGARRLLRLLPQSDGPKEFQSGGPSVDRASLLERRN